MGKTMINKFLKPCVKVVFLRQVVHSPSSHTAVAASTQEEALRPKVPTYTDVDTATKIGQVLADRFKAKDIPAVSFRLERGQRYHGKRKVLLDNLRDNGVKLL